MTDQLESRADARLRQRGEVDRRGDVLQARQDQRIVVRAMTVMAQQSTVATLGKVELATHIAVIDDERRAACLLARNGFKPPRQLRQHFRAIAVLEFPAE